MITTKQPSSVPRSGVKLRHVLAVLALGLAASVQVAAVSPTPTPTMPALAGPLTATASLMSDGNVRISIRSGAKEVGGYYGDPRATVTLHTDDSGWADATATPDPSTETSPAVTTETQEQVNVRQKSYLYPDRSPAEIQRMLHPGLSATEAAASVRPAASVRSSTATAVTGSGPSYTVRADAALPLLKRMASVTTSALTGAGTPTSTGCAEVSYYVWARGCYQRHGTSTSTRNISIENTEASGHGNSSYWMDILQTRVTYAYAPNNYIFDVKPPNDDSSGDCHTVNYGLSYGLASASSSWTQCASGNKIAYSAHYFRNEWWGLTLASYVATGSVVGVTVQKGTSSQFSYKVTTHGCTFVGGFCATTTGSAK